LVYSNSEHALNLDVEPAKPLQQDDAAVDHGTAVNGGIVGAVCSDY
jgi:hypothetical protein